MKAFRTKTLSDQTNFGGIRVLAISFRLLSATINNRFTDPMEYFLIQALPISFQASKFLIKAAILILRQPARSARNSQLFRHANRPQPSAPAAKGRSRSPTWTTVEEEVLIRIYKRENAENASDEIVNRKLEVAFSFSKKLAFLRTVEKSVSLSFQAFCSPI